MTATDPAPLYCPQCGGTNTMVGGSGQGMCFECAHTWDPTEVVGLPRPTIAPFGMADEADVFGPDSADVERETADVDVVVEPAASAPPITQDPPDPHAFAPSWEGLRLFREAGGTISDEAWWSDIMGGPADDLDPVPPTDDGPPPETVAALTIAAEILEAGIVAAWIADRPGVKLIPFTGYLPDDPAMLPVVEQACAIAVGMLIDRFDVPLEDVAASFGVTIEVPTQGDQTTEVADEQGPSQAE